MSMQVKIFADTPFVAHIGERNELQVVEQNGDLLCRSRPGLVLFTQTIMLLVGGGLSAMVWSALHPTRGVRTPMPVILFIGLLAGLCLMMFVRNLLGTPHFLVRGADGEIQLFRCRGANPSRIIPASEISSFTVEQQAYLYQQHQTTNWMLIALLADGQRLALCGSPDQALIRSLATKVETLTGKLSNAASSNQ
jgi:hypothetical protein